MRDLFRIELTLRSFGSAPVRSGHCASSSPLGAIGRLDRDEFEADDATLERMNAFYARWQVELGEVG